MPLGAALGTAGLKPGVCTSSTRPTAPYPGQLIYETDVFRTSVWDGTGWYILDERMNTAWVPTFGGITVASSTRAGYYKRSAGFLDFYASFIMGATPTVFANNPTLTLPFSCQFAAQVQIAINDSGVSWRYGVAMFPQGLGTSIPMTLVNMGSTYGDQALFSLTAPQTWNVNDAIYVSGHCPLQLATGAAYI